MVLRAPKARPLSFYVVTLAAALTLPPMALSVVVAGRWVGAERLRLEATARQTVDGAMEQVDRYLSGKVGMLQALATSPALDAGDFRRMDQQARELLDLQGANIVLRELSGQQVISTRLPWGTKLPRVPNYDTDRHVFQTRAPYISDLYAGVMAGAPLIRVIVPVLRNGELKYTLTASLPPKALSQLLSDAGVREPLSASVVDRNGRILSRLPFDEAVIGQALPAFSETAGSRGTWEGRNPDGQAVLGMYTRSPLSGWLFTIGVQRSIVDAPLYRSLGWIIALALGLGCLAFGTSLWIVRRLIGSHQQVIAAAAALGHGEVISAPSTAMRETNLIGQALAAASQRLEEQARALTSINRDLERRVDERTRELSSQAKLLEATLDNMAQGLMMIDRDKTVPICNQRAIEFLDLPAELMRSRPPFAAVLRHQIDRGEFALSNREFQHWVETAGVEPVEHTYERERPDGRVLEIRTVPLEGGGAVRTYTDITARKHGERLSYQMARHDPLTGLPNRTLFAERLLEAVQGRDGVAGPFAVLCLDLDRFKNVNDTLGHPAGDALLRKVSDVIRAAVGPDDTVARLGGDEFAVIRWADRVTDAAADAEALARHLVTTLGEPFDLGNCTVDIGASVGVSLGADGESDADQVFKNADRALYRAKQEGRNTFRFFEPAMDIAAQRRHALELDIKQALGRQEFELHYQPVIATDVEATAGFEALLRWRHPEQGMVSPVEFIPIAEDTRLIGPIGEWVLQEACREASSWPGEITVSVNVSPIQFQSAALLQSVTSALAESGLAPHRLEIEITETTLIEESDTVLQTLHALRALGVRIALDDFGTGYSSLSYLHRFPLDRIKIDRSFIKGSADRTTAAIVRTIVGLASRLGAAVTAEGVETREQLDFVRREGCSHIQGYLFSPPVPPAEARRYLMQAKRATAA